MTMHDHQGSDVFALAHRIADYSAEEIFGAAPQQAELVEANWAPLTDTELPWNDVATLSREVPQPNPHRHGRLLTGLAAAVALVVLIAGLTFAHLLHQRQDAPVGPPQPAPSPATPTAGQADVFGGLDAAGKAALVTACTHAYAAWAKDALVKAPTTTGYTLRAAVQDKSGSTTVISGVLSNGTTRLVCNTKPSDGLREPAKDTVPSATSKTTFAFSDSDTQNYGLAARDLVWAGGRLPASVTRLTYTWPDKHVAQAAVSPDGYWVMQYLAPRVFTTGSYGDLSPAVVTLTMADGSTRNLKLGWDVDTSCAAVNLGGC